MNRDPTSVGRARIGAEMVAEVFNGFVEPISWKTLVSGLFFLFFIECLLYIAGELTEPWLHPSTFSIPLYLSLSFL
jgi:hypothetical protein